MEIRETYNAETRTDWRAWLATHHSSTAGIRLVLQKSPDSLALAYLDAVEEAICFGWIDGISESLNDVERAQRFTPADRKATGMMEAGFNETSLPGVTTRQALRLQGPGTNFPAERFSNLASRDLTRTTCSKRPSGSPRPGSFPSACHCRKRGWRCRQFPRFPRRLF